MSDDYLLLAHKEWIGYVQPVGLLAVPAVLIHRGVIPDRNVADLQERLDAMTRTSEEADPVVTDFVAFTAAFLGWNDHDLSGVPGNPPLPEDLCVELTEYGERLAPTYALPAAGKNANGWQLLIRVEMPGTDLDAAIIDDGKYWAASPHARFERLLRGTNVPVGLLTNLRSFRLVYAPKGETSGFATFDLKSMLELAGRPMLSAFHMLLKVERLFGSPEQNLPSLLAESRQYQETVSTQLAEQVLVALNELLRGSYTADARMSRTMTVDLAKSDPDHLYGGLLTALMRLVFILYAEDRDLFPRNKVWEQNYSLGGLFERLRDDAVLYPDTMDDRYGSWAQLIALWRLMYFGSKYADMKLIARRGQLFDPTRFPFLEGRKSPQEPPNIPTISDGVVWRILRALMVLDGERLSYRTLDVEQVGSVYQSVIGFTIELTEGPSIAVRAPKRGGAATTINLQTLLAEAPVKRAEWIRQRTDRNLTSKHAIAVKESNSVPDLEAALSPVTDGRITPKLLPAGVPVLQPTEVRRRTGSYYTPRELTAPIVSEALRPALERLGPQATPGQILELKVLDPAVGSGAFLVESCRQLADRLVVAWELHGNAPSLPPDEDAVQHARRLVAQSCLYGVDRNSMAVDLAKLSLWLATLARDHEFTFLDHALRHGDSLVGLFREEIAKLNWLDKGNESFAARLVHERLSKAAAERQRIRTAADAAGEHELTSLLEKADEQLVDLNLIGDTLVAAFFDNQTSKSREAAREKMVRSLGLGETGWQDRLKTEVNLLDDARNRLNPFHWELQFPEVFLRENPGFDLIIGNPPYAGKNTIINSNPDHYLTWLQTIHEGAHGNADLVAHFFRRAFRLLRHGGTFGLIATNTIRQGDTRNVGLRWIRHHSGIIYTAKRRYKWPAAAAVVVSIVHVAKGEYNGFFTLDNRRVKKITAYLFDQGGDDDPYQLISNSDQCFEGTHVLGMGFTFDDTDKKGIALPLSEARRLVLADPRNGSRIREFIGGEEVVTDPRQLPHRKIIDFGDMSLDEAEQWPELLDIVRQRVLPERLKDKRLTYRNNWWKFAERRPRLYEKISGLKRVLVNSKIAHHLAFAFLPNGWVYSKRLNVIAREDASCFAVLQSRVHEVWARFFGASLEDRLSYTASDVLETFPFPESGFNDELAVIGARYVEHRAKIMIATNKGLTETYNRFANPNDKASDIETLRTLHADMDRAVLDAYGWRDIFAEPDFEKEWMDDDGDGPVRYRWPEETRDRVLARLLDLNTERACDEARRGLRKSLVLKDTNREGLQLESVEV